jgi:multidrug resistance efflux pump
MKRAHRRSHLLIWLVLVPVTVVFFYMALSLKKPDPYTDDAVMQLIEEGQ